jgi:hypothetical protein
MSLAAGARLGPCEILAHLGSGGMRTAYGAVCRVRQSNRPFLLAGLSPKPNVQRDLGVPAAAAPWGAP